MNYLQLIETFLLVAMALYLMMLAGTAKNALEPRRARRTCPSCGRSARECACRD